MSFHPMTFCHLPCAWHNHALPPGSQPTTLGLPSLCWASKQLKQCLLESYHLCFHFCLLVFLIRPQIPSGQKLGDIILFPFLSIGPIQIRKGYENSWVNDCVISLIVNSTSSDLLWPNKFFCIKGFMAFPGSSHNFLIKSSWGFDVLMQVTGMWINHSVSTFLHFYFVLKIL